MKKYFPLLFLMILGTLILNSGCSKTSDNSSPCDGKGTLCIENKLDSSIVVTLKTTHNQFTIPKDYMHCTDLTGDATYSINISATGIDRDTLLTIFSCDKKLLIIQ